MSALSLDVGKTYVRHDKAQRVDAPGALQLVKIVGRVGADTLEHAKGWRYFSDIGEMFTPDGQYQPNPRDAEDRWDPDRAPTLRFKQGHSLAR